MCQKHFFLKIQHMFDVPSDKTIWLSDKDSFLKSIGRLPPPAFKWSGPLQPPPKGPLPPAPDWGASHGPPQTPLLQGPDPPLSNPCTGSH